MRYRSLLVYLDTRRLTEASQLQPALESCARLALAHDARLTLCDVVEAPPRESRPGPAARLGALRLRYAEEVLKRLTHTLERTIRCHYTVLQGPAFLTLTRFVMRQGVDLVVVPAVADSNPRQSAIAAHLVRKCPATVWQLPPRATPSRARLAVALDRELFASSELPGTMAARLLDTAVALGRGDATTIHLLHAWQVYGAELLDDPGLEWAEEEASGYVDSQRYSHTLWLEEMHSMLRAKAEAAGLVHLHSETCLLEGAPEDAIPAWVDANAVDILIVGNTGSSATPGIFIGNTAESLLSRTSGPTVVVKPEAFRSPVRSS